ncbi:MAG: DNA repair protein RecO [Planctomycetota bacterium]
MGSTRTPRRAAPPRVARADDALLLRRSHYGETSLVAEVLSPEYGLCSILARGAYRPTSRFFCVLDLFDTLELEWNERPESELALLVRGDRRRLRRAVSSDLAAYRAALAGLDSAQAVARRGREERALYRLLEEFLDALQATPERADLELAAFDLRFLDQLGLAPALAHCARCGRDAPAPDQATVRSAFSAEAGGRLCRACAAEAREEGARVGSLATRTLIAAEILGSLGPGALAGEVERNSRVLLENERPRVRDFVERFLEYHLERRPKARRRLPSPGS